MNTVNRIIDALVRLVVARAHAGPEEADLIVRFQPLIDGLRRHLHARATPEVFARVEAVIMQTGFFTAYTPE